MGRIESLNVGAIREFEWRGRTVRTAIWKEPVEGPLLIADDVIAGDHQADRRVHGGPDMAVYAYAVEDYRWWVQELARELPPGTFGENMTTSGLDLTGSCIGDRWHIGAVVLEVTQPRTPCFKLGIKMGDQGIVKRFERAARPGVYLRIIVPGEVDTGDTIEVEPATQPAVSIRELLTTPDPDLLERARDDERIPPRLRHQIERSRA